MVRRPTWCLHSIARPDMPASALDPVAESLGIYAETLADPGNRPTGIPGLRPQLEDHRHRTFPQLGGVLLP
jgi:hypothetical protein